MPTYCAAFGCFNRTGTRKRKAGVSISMHKFPAMEHEPHRYRRWLTKLNRENFKPTSSSRLCSAHFVADDYERDLFGELMPDSRLRRPKLKPNAVPTIFPQLKRAVKKTSSGVQESKQAIKKSPKLAVIKKSPKLVVKKKCFLSELHDQLSVLDGLPLLPSAKVAPSVKSRMQNMLKSKKLKRELRYQFSLCRGCIAALSPPPPPPPPIGFSQPSILLLMPANVAPQTSLVRPSCQVLLQPPPNQEKEFPDFGICAKSGSLLKSSYLEQMQKIPERLKPDCGVALREDEETESSPADVQQPKTDMSAEPSEIRQNDEQGLGQNEGDIFGGFLEIKPETDVNCDAGFEYPFIESLLPEGEIKEEPEDTEGDSHCVEEGVKDEPLEEETGAIISEEKQGEKGEEEEREVRPATGATAAEATPTALIVSNDYARKMEHEVELLQALVKSLQSEVSRVNKERDDWKMQAAQLLQTSSKEIAQTRSLEKEICKLKNDVSSLAQITVALAGERDACKEELQSFKLAMGVGDVRVVQ